MGKNILILFIITAIIGFSLKIYFSTVTIPDNTLNIRGSYNISMIDSLFNLDPFNSRKGSIIYIS